MGKSRTKIFLVFGMLFSFICVTLFSMIYMAKDNYFNNTIFQYFNISKELFGKLIYIDISKSVLVCGMNMSSLLFLICNYTLSQIDWPRQQRRLRMGLVIFWLAQVILYSPFSVRFFYYGGLGFFPDPVVFRRVYQVFHGITVSGNFLTILMSFVYMDRNAVRKEPIKDLRVMKWSLTTMNAGICILYFYMYFSLPDSFLWMSRALNYTAYKSLDMPPYIRFMRMIPYLVILFLLFLLLSSYRYDRAARKLREKDYVFSTIAASSEISIRVFSHYIKNEMLGILSEAEWVMKAPEEHREGLETIRNSCLEVYERLDLLQQNANRIVLNQSLNNILTILADTLKKNKELFAENKINLIDTAENKEVKVFCDGHYMEEVFRNLILNAVDAMKDQLVGERTITVTTTLYDRQIKIEFKDSGPGISPSVMDNLFEPFISTKSTKHNWGIGLSFVKRIIQSHNGKIEVENSADGGAVFSVYLPIVE